MPHYYLITRDVDDAVDGEQQSESAGLVYPPGSGRTAHDVPEAVHAQAVASPGLHHPGSGDLRWMYTEAGGLQPRADARPTVRITHPVMGQDVEYDVGDTSLPLTITLLRPDGTPNTNFNQTRRVVIADRRIKLAFTAGVANLRIPTGRSYAVVLDSTADFIVENACRVAVYDDAF